MPKFILNCAVTSTVHVYARDPESGMPTGDLDVMGEIVSTIPHLMHMVQIR